MTYDLNLVFVKVKPLEDMMLAGDLRRLIIFELESRLIGLLRNIAVQELEKSGVERKGCEQVEAFCDALLQVEPESLLCDDATIFQLKQAYTRSDMVLVLGQGCWKTLGSRRCHPASKTCCLCCRRKTQQPFFAI